MDTSINPEKSQPAPQLPTLHLEHYQEHPVAKFGTGNKFTLKERTKDKGIDLRAKLLSWHDQFYSANQMTLAICGKDVCPYPAPNLSKVQGQNLALSSGTNLSRP